jgi:hypothetical protein
MSDSRFPATFFKRPERPDSQEYLEYYSPQSGGADGQVSRIGPQPIGRTGINLDDRNCPVFKSA